jgi:large subunit ribosomal protein L21
LQSEIKINRIIMYAIVEIAGQQFKVEKGKKIFVHRLDAENGKKVEFDKVLLIDDEGKITIGEPVIKDTVIEGMVIDHVRGDKVIVFKKKRRKGYKVTKGHRQNFTRVEILSINEKSLPEKAPAKKEAAHVKAETVVEKKSPEQKPEAKKSKTKKETAPAKKTAVKKPADKETTKGKASK